MLTSLKRLSVLVLGLLSLTTSMAYAEDDAHHSLSLEGGYKHFGYQESFPAPFKSKDSGYLPEVGFTYTRIGNQRVFFRVHGDFAGGDTSFSGGAFTSKLGLGTRAQELYWNVNGDLGYTWATKALSIPVALTPFVDAGYRRYSRDVSVLSEEFSSIYGGLGLRTDWFVSPRLKISPEIMGRLSFSSQMHASVQGLGEASTMQSMRPALYASLPISYRITKHWAATLAFNWERIYLGSGKSPLGEFNGLSFMQPPSMMETYGVRLGVTYHFD